METFVAIVSVIVPSVITLIGCMINNNVTRTKEQHQIEMQIAAVNAKIEMQIAAVNANYDKSTALIRANIEELSDKVNKHNNVIERTYKCEDRLNIVEHDIRDIRKDIDDGK
ncbi:MAG: hypothetical protein K5886_02855 [Lachnospiraceae bacterium]|nr:hypothetical protein [Lachnospiraceae bacterium]